MQLDWKNPAEPGRFLVNRAAYIDVGSQERKAANGWPIVGPINCTWSDPYLGFLSSIDRTAATTPFSSHQSPSDPSPPLFLFPVPNPSATYPLPWVKAQAPPRPPLQPATTMHRGTMRADSWIGLGIGSGRVLWGRTTVGRQLGTGSIVVKSVD